jgi:hypothetical protein
MSANSVPAILEKVYFNEIDSPLLAYRRNVASQDGEDGIIDKIFDVVGTKNKYCIEFGAWDGLHWTNTRNLIESAGYSAVLIEAEKRRYECLLQNYSLHANRITAINEFVGFGDHDNLDAMLRKTPTPPDFDVLSIDIDGNDFTCSI